MMQHQGRLVFSDNLKLTDTAERFITFSPFVSWMMNHLHGGLYCFLWSLLDILRNIYQSPLCRNKSNLLLYICERIHPSFAFIMLFFIRVPNNRFCYVWKAKQTRPRPDFFVDEFPLGETLHSFVYQCQHIFYHVSELNSSVSSLLVDTIY